MATLNLQGPARVELRLEVDDWMEQEKVDILAAQETKDLRTRVERRVGYSWFFLGR